MFATDIVGIYAERATEVEDFGMAASNFTMPLVCLYAAVLWFRAFMLHERLVSGFFFALVTLPGWLLFTAIVTLMNFPLGRISPNF
ncbi:hypothetical protein FF011L_03090 [Roseimaritima multifibrata]|uniref:Uncharacterized protein n=2 Tax=Roseimaritima multifibrata TaxID=1930274 RepID=A0A517M9L9_9BACT|nr:hypothetical protein FF011L_03090 [Roseimaritima multifibrata]